MNGASGRPADPAAIPTPAALGPVRRPAGGARRPMLHVAIPTFNRAAPLAATLAVIGPQLGDDARCVVLDNASTDETPDVVAAACRRFPAIESRRNAANVGSGPNILRCFEVADEGWIWTLADDDIPRDDAIATILAVTAEFPDACYVNFATDVLTKFAGVRRDATTRMRGIDEFVRGLDCFHNLLFITAGVHNASVARHHLRHAYLEVPSFATQAAIVLEALVQSPTLEAVQSPRLIASHAGTREWNWQAVAAGTHRLMALVPDPSSRARLARLILDHFPAHMGYGSVVTCLLNDMQRGDAALAEDVRRYAFLAATIGRYRLAALLAIACQSINPYGGRILAGMLLGALGRIRSRPAPTATPPGGTLEQLRQDRRV